jgi:hypothetical protein
MKSSWLITALLAWTGSAAGAAAVASPATSAAPAGMADCNAAAFATVLQAEPGETAAAAHWLARGRIRWPGPAPVTVDGGRYALAFVGADAVPVEPGRSIGGPRAQAPAPTPSLQALRVTTQPLPPALAARFAFVAPGVDLQLPAAALARVPALLRGALQLVQTDARGRVLRATGLQLAGVLDAVYARAAALPDLGVTVAQGHTAFQLWAPTAQRVALCLHGDGSAPASRLLPCGATPPPVRGKRRCPLT